MGDNESNLTLTEQVDGLRVPGTSLAARAWEAVSDWGTEDVLVGFLLVPIAIAAGGILAVALLFTATLFAPVLLAWLVWLAFRAGARARRPFVVRGTT